MNTRPFHSRWCIRQCHLVWAGVALMVLLALQIGMNAVDATTAEKARRVDDIFKALKQNPPYNKKAPPNSTFRITEDELNAYLKQEYVAKPHSGLKSIVVHLYDDNQVAADSIVNVDDLKTENSTVLQMLTLLFSGDQSLHVEARLLFNGNTVAYRLERAQFNSMTLPTAAVEKLIEILARRLTQKIDVTKPIPLAPSIKHVEIRKGVLIIQT